VAVEPVSKEDVAGHLARERAADLALLAPEERIAGFPHQRNAAVRRDVVIERLACLDVSDNRAAWKRCQHIPGQQSQDLIAPENPTFTVHHADPVAVAVEGDAEIALLGQNRRLQLSQVLRHGGIGMVRGKIAVDRRIEQGVPPGKPAREFRESLARRAVTGIPSDRQRALAAVVVARESLNVCVEHRRVAHRPDAALLQPTRRRGTQLLQRLTKHRAVTHDELEPVLVGRVVRPRHHQAGDGVELMQREVEHRCRSQTDALDLEPRLAQALDRGSFQSRGGVSTVETNRHAAAVAPDRLAERVTDRPRVLHAEGRAHDAADIIFQ